MRLLLLRAPDRAAEARSGDPIGVHSTGSPTYNQSAQRTTWRSLSASKNLRNFCTDGLVAAPLCRVDRCDEFKVEQPPDSDRSVELA